VVVLSGLCVAPYLPLYTAHVEQMWKENGALPHGCFCRLVTAALVLQALLPFVLVHTSLPVTSNTGCSLLVSEPSLPQPESPESRGGLVLACVLFFACVPVVMALSLELKSALPTSTITFRLSSVFLWGMNTVSEWESYSSLSLKLTCTVM